MREITKKITFRMQIFYAAFTLFFSFLLSRLCLDVPRPAFDLFGIWFSLEAWQIDRVFLPFAALLNFALSQLLRLWYIRRVLRREMAYLKGGDDKHRRVLLLWLLWPGELLRLILYFINRGILFQKSTVILEASLFKETLASWLWQGGMGNFAAAVATALAYLLYLGAFLLVILPLSERIFRTAEAEYEDLVRY